MNPHPASQPLPMHTLHQYTGSHSIPHSSFFLSEHFSVITFLHSLRICKMWLQPACPYLSCGTHCLATFLPRSVLALQLGLGHALPRGHLPLHQGALLLGDHLALLLRHQLTFRNHPFLTLLLRNAHAHMLVLVFTFLHLQWDVYIF